MNEASLEMDVDCLKNMVCEMIKSEAVFEQEGIGGELGPYINSYMIKNDVRL